MRHRMSGRKLSMPSDQRKALLRSLVSSLLWHDEIDTTEPRAKEAIRVVERIITLAKKDTLQARRQVQGMIFEQSIPFQGTSDKSHSDSRNQHRLLRRIFQELGPIYRDVRGGYTRIIRLGPRRGDAAMMVRLELTKGVSIGQRSPGRRAAAKPTPAPAAQPTAPVAAAPGVAAPAAEIQIGPATQPEVPAAAPDQDVQEVPAVAPDREAQEAPAAAPDREVVETTA